MNPWLNLLFIFRHTIISDECATPELGPLLIRWHLLRLPGGRAIMLHCFLRSDNDRHYHDHPWAFRSFLLSPYVEHMPVYEWGIPDDYGGPDMVYHRKRFSLLHRPANWRHWVETIQPLTWTLVYHGPRERQWGFVTERGWLSAASQYRKHFGCD